MFSKGFEGCPFNYYFLNQIFSTTVVAEKLTLAILRVFRLLANRSTRFNRFKINRSPPSSFQRGSTDHERSGSDAFSLGRCNLH